MLPRVNQVPSRLYIPITKYIYIMLIIFLEEGRLIRWGGGGWIFMHIRIVDKTEPDWEDFTTVVLQGFVFLTSPNTVVFTKLFFFTPPNRVVFWCQYIMNKFQMVWAKTDEVGCAAQRCAKLNLVEEFVPNGWFITCLYNPKFVQFLLLFLH